MKSLLVAAGLFVGASAWAETTTVGADDNSAAWWTAFSDYYTLEANQTLNISFKNYTNKSANGNNWVAVITTDADRNDTANGYEEYFVLRADNYGWGSVYSANKLSSYYNWDTFKDDMDGATVDMTVKRVGKEVILHADITTAGGTKYFENFSAVCGAGTQPIRFFLTTEGGHLTNISSTKYSAKAVTKYSFDNAISPSLSAGSKSTLDYSHTSVVTSTAFLNNWGANDTNGATVVSLGSTDLSTEDWTLDFYWAGYSGCNKKAGNTVLKAGSTTLFTIADAADWGSTMALTYGESNTTISVYPCNASSRITAKTGDALNATDYWHHFIITGNSDGVKMSIIRCSDAANVVTNVVLSATNVNPTEIQLKSGSAGSVAIDELALSYAVEGEVIQTPIANYTAVNGISRTITATCDTEGATIKHSTDGETYEDGASVTVSASGKVYFKAVKGTSESDVLEFDAVAGTAITLNAPVINRTSNTSVTITADQTNLLLSPTATIYYSYNGEESSFTGSKVLTVSAEGTITARAEATGYTTANASREVALFPTNVAQIENATYTTNFNTKAFDDTKAKTGSDSRTYAPYLLTKDETTTQWSSKVYFNYTESEGEKSSAWNSGVRNGGTWYINGNGVWLMVTDMQAGDIIQARLTQAAVNTVNATYSEKYSYGDYHAYIVDADGDAELSFNRVNSSTNNYFYGIYAFGERSVSVPCTNGFATYANHDYALDFTGVSGLTAYTATVEGDVVTFTPATKVPAGTGLLLKGATADVPVIASADAISENIFYAPTTAVASLNYDQDEYYNYILTSVGGNVGFYRANNNSVAVGKAYLRIAKSTGARQFTFIGLDNNSETTGIDDVKGVNSDNENFYNLNGQRIVAPQKGLYIVNGKKVVLK